jgi:hypothetical protein
MRAQEPTYETFRTIAVDGSNVPKLWEVQLFGETYYCRVSLLSEELSEKYRSGRLWERPHHLADFCREGPRAQFDDIEAALAWFATDWDIFAQDAAARFFAVIDPLRYGELN